MGMELNGAQVRGPAADGRARAWMVQVRVWPGTRREPFTFTPMGVNPISSGSPPVRPMGRTCGEPDEIKKNTHPKYFAALFRAAEG